MPLTGFGVLAKAMQCSVNRPSPLQPEHAFTQRVWIFNFSKSSMDQTLPHFFGGIEAGNHIGKQQQVQAAGREGLSRPYPEFGRKYGIFFLRQRSFVAVVGERNFTVVRRRLGRPAAAQRKPVPPQRRVSRLLICSCCFCSAACRSSACVNTQLTELRQRIFKNILMSAIGICRNLCKSTKQS